MVVARVLVLGLAALLTACGTPQLAGSYEGTLVEGRDLERHVRLKLQDDGRASVSTARWGSFSYFAEGSWKRTTDRLMMVDLASAPPQRLVFQYGGELLIPKEWDRAVWGDRGPGVLKRVR